MAKVFCHGKLEVISNTEQGASIDVSSAGHCIRYLVVSFILTLRLYSYDPCLIKTIILQVLGFVEDVTGSGLQ